MLAAMLLAAAVLTAAGPRQVRQRARIVEPRPRWQPSAVADHDALAGASALEVLAVCLSAGMSVAAAAALTAPAAPTELRRILQRAADLLALGADPQTAWRSETDDPLCQAVLRLARRSAVSGSALADAVADLAAQLREQAAHTAVAAAERAGVLIAGPLGLCFLPAFVCLGIVPVVVSLAGQIFGAGLR